MKIIIDSKIELFSNIEIAEELPVFRQIISYLDNRNFDTSRAKVVYRGKQINPEHLVSNLPGVSDTPKFFVLNLTPRNNENHTNAMPDVQPQPISQPQAEVESQFAEVNKTNEESSKILNESDGEEKPTPKPGQKITAREPVSSTMANDDEKLAMLMEEGYEYEDACQALQEFDGNLEEARKSLWKKANPEKDEVEVDMPSSNDEATILDNLLKSKNEAIIDLRKNIRNDPSYIFQWIESLREKGQDEWVDFFQRNAEIIVDAIFESPEEAEEREETIKPPKENKPLPKASKPLTKEANWQPSEVKHQQKQDRAESDSDMSDISFDSNDSELNEL